METKIVKLFSTIVSLDPTLSVSLCTLLVIVLAVYGAYQVASKVKDSGVGVLRVYCLLSALSIISAVFVFWSAS